MEHLKTLLSSIIPGDSESAIRAFKKRVEARRLEDSDEGEQSPSVRGNLGNEEQEETLEYIIAAEARDLISNYEAYLDSTVGEGALKAVDYVSSEETAIRAVSHYTKDWFSSLPASFAMKQAIAAKLIEAIKPYYNYSSPVWNSIRDGDPQVLLDISYKHGEQ